MEKLLDILLVLLILNVVLSIILKLQDIYYKKLQRKINNIKEKLNIT